VAVNKDYIGRTFPPGEPYEVSRVKIAEFADAIGDPSPVYRSREAAQAAGHPDVIAPPTFAIVISMANSGRAIGDPELGVNYAMIVHGEQKFEYARPIQAGDVLIATSTISNIRETGKLTMINTTTDIKTESGEQVCTAHSILVERGV
jgi:acyl dehydratase